MASSPLPSGFLRQAFTDLGAQQPVAEIADVEALNRALDHRFPPSRPEESGQEEAGDRFLASLQGLLACLMHPDSVGSFQQILHPLSLALGSVEPLTEPALVARLTDWYAACQPPYEDAAFTRLLWRRMARTAGVACLEQAGGTWSVGAARLRQAGERNTRERMLQLMSRVSRGSGASALAPLLVMAGVGPADIPWDASSDFDQLARDMAVAMPSGGDRTLLIAAMSHFAWLDEELSERESEHIEILAAALGLSDDQLLRVQAEVARDVGVGDVPWWPKAQRGVQGFWGRMSGSTSRVVQKVVVKNLHAVSNEIQETGDLLVLLHRSLSEELTAAERDRMTEQMHDLCRAVPCLALFAAPGGSLLIPVLQRILPINLLPSSFSDDADPVAIVETESGGE